MDVKKCGAFLQALRKAKGLTQTQLAEVMCVSPKTVSKWECGDAIPEITALMALAEFYGVTVDEILKGERACAGAPVLPETEERNAKANNLYLLNKKQDSLKLFTIISTAIIAVGLILQIILLFTVSYTVGVCVNMAISVAACATFIAGYLLCGGHPEQYLEGGDLTKLNISKLRVKTIVITALVCNVVQAVVPYCFLETVTESLNYIKLTYTHINTAALWLTPIVTFIAGAIIGIMCYYKFGEKYGIKTPEFGTKVAKLHLPLYLAIVIYLLLIICNLWYAYYGDGSSTTAWLSVSGYDCFYKCYVNPLFYFWAAAMIAAVVLAVLSFKKKVNFAVTYLIIGISFIIFYWFTAYGARLYAIDYTAYSIPYAFTGVNNNASPMSIVTGILYMVCAVLLAIMTGSKKAVDEQHNLASPLT